MNIEVPWNKLRVGDWIVTDKIKIEGWIPDGEFAEVQDVFEENVGGVRTVNIRTDSGTPRLITFPATHAEPFVIARVEPSPRPWFHGMDLTDVCAKQTNDEYAFVASTNMQADLPYELRIANAAHLVRCVNQHDALVEALEDLLDMLGCSDPLTASDLAPARAVLAKARA